jgi:exosortase
MLNLKEGPRRHALFLLLSVVFFAVMSGPILELIHYALDTENQNASQVLLIPVISATLIYLNRKNIFRDIRAGVVPGILLISAGAVMFSLGSMWGTNLDAGDRLALSIFPILVIWWGGVVFFYGVQAFKAGLFPLVFLVFCVPIPSPVMERTITFLQHASADVAFVLLKLTGTPIYREGVLFFLPGIAVEVAPECSGIRSGIGLFVLGVIAAGVFLKSWPTKAALLLMVIPIAIFKNGVRITTLSYLAVHVDERILTSSLHREGGIPFFLLALLLLYPVLSYLIKSEAGISKRQSAREVRL